MIVLQVISYLVVITFIVLSILGSITPLLITDEDVKHVVIWRHKS
jgi:hypothetical protein